MELFNKASVKANEMADKEEEAKKDIILDSFSSEMEEYRKRQEAELSRLKNESVGEKKKKNSSKKDSE